MEFIAEIGSNWMGKLVVAQAHIDHAAAVGATGTKFQLFQANTLYRDGQPALEPFELQRDQIRMLREAAHRANVAFSVTPFAPELVEWLAGEVDAVKISAYDLTFDDLVREAAQLKVPLVLSTAMATRDEIERALTIAIVNGAPAVTLLHGVAAYPASTKDYNLHALPTLQRWFPQCQVGLSDHTLTPDLAPAAVALGATHIEKHFSISTAATLESPDRVVSVGPGTFRAMVTRCRTVAGALGTGTKDGPLPCEMELYRTARRTNQQRVRGWGLV